MLTMTSLEAQNNFGALLDNSQREPVLITRRGRPVSILISPAGDPSKVLAQTMMALREVQPMGRAQAARQMAQRFEARYAAPSVAEAEGLTEDDINRMVEEEREAIELERTVAASNAKTLPR
jgi:prevent-host-death family protein